MCFTVLGVRNSRAIQWCVNGTSRALVAGIPKFHLSGRYATTQGCNMLEVRGHVALKPPKRARLKQHVVSYMCSEIGRANYGSKYERTH